MRAALWSGPGGKSSLGIAGTVQQPQEGGRRGRGENFHCLRCVVLHAAKNAKPFAKNTHGSYLKNAGHFQRTGWGGSRETSQVVAEEMRAGVGKGPAEGRCCLPQGMGEPGSRKVPE